MDDVMPTHKQTQNLTNRDLVGYTMDNKINLILLSMAIHSSVKRLGTS